MAGEAQFSLFGTPSPEEMRAAIGKAGLAEDIQMAGVPALSAPRVAMGQAGRLFGNTLGGAFGGQDVRLQRAEQMKAVQQSVFQKAKRADIDFANKPEEYMKLAANELMAAGFTGEAYKVIQELQNRQAQAADTEYKEGATRANAREVMIKEIKAEYEIDDLISKKNTRAGTLRIQEMRNQLLAEANKLRAGTNAKSAQDAKLLSYAIPILDKMQTDPTYTPTEQETMMLKYALARRDLTVDNVVAKMFEIPDPTNVVPDPTNADTVGSDWGTE